MAHAPLATVLDVIDQIEGRKAGDASAQNLRSSLACQVQQVFSDQGITVPPDELGQAIEVVLTRDTPPMAPVSFRFPFGWRRPRSMAALQRRRQGLGQRWRRYVVERAQASDERHMASSLRWAIGLLVLVALPVALISGEVVAGAGMGMVAFFFGFPLMTWALRPLFSILDAHWGKDVLKECFLDERQLQSFLRSSDTRDYLRACHLSPVPMVLEGDVVRLEAMRARAIEEEARRIEDDFQASQRAEQRARVLGTANGAA